MQQNYDDEAYDKYFKQIHNNHKYFVNFFLGDLKMHFRKTGILKLLKHTGVFPRNVTGSASGPRAKEKAHKA